MKIVMLSKGDYAGSGMRIRDAIRRHYPEHNIVLVTLHHPAHKADYAVCEMKKKVYENPNPGQMQSIHDRIRNKAVLKQFERIECSPIQKLIDECDIVHFKGDEPPVTNWNDKLTIPPDKKIVVTVGGSFFRRKALHPGTALAAWPMEDYMKADLRTALTPDLNYKEFKGIYTQQAIDCENVKRIPMFRDLSKDTRIFHSPSSIAKKGTENVFLPAIKNLRSTGRKVFLQVLNGVPFEECVEMKKSADIFFDQAGVGFYGNAALEAMQYGIPTVCHISPEAVKQSDGKITKKHPVIALRQPTVGACFNALRRAYDSNLEELSIATKKFCDEFHSYSVVAKMWDELYRGLFK